MSNNQLNSVIFQNGKVSYTLDFELILYIFRIVTEGRKCFYNSFQNPMKYKLPKDLAYQF